ncbi:MAG: FadR family transcriptional regulator [Oscillospiraceae bacterium]|nr:FadR family transcriptional regulator [Oscillospiraceae bacterium]
MKQIFSSEDIQRFDKTNVSTSIKDLVIKKLLEGELHPGDKLPTEMEFSSQLCVSRNSVREAVKMLSSLDIIEIRRGEGTFIRSTISDSVLNPLIIQLAFAQKTPQELIELRVFLETALVELALEKKEDKDIELLESINKQMRIAIAGHADSREISHLDYEFHSALIRMTRNDLIIKIGETIYTLFFSSINDSILSNEAGGYGYQNHKKIIEALKTDDKAQVRSAVKASLAHWKKQLEMNRDNS